MHVSFLGFPLLTVLPVSLVGWSFSLFFSRGCMFVFSGLSSEERLLDYCSALSPITQVPILLNSVFGRRNPSWSALINGVIHNAVRAVCRASMIKPFPCRHADTDHTSHLFFLSFLHGQLKATGGSLQKTSPCDTLVVAGCFYRLYYGAADSCGSPSHKCITLNRINIPPPSREAPANECMTSWFSLQENSLHESQSRR